MLVVRYSPIMNRDDMHRRGNKRAGTAARLIMLLIVGLSIAIFAITIHILDRNNPPERGDQVMPGQVAEQLGQRKAPAALPH